ncbi:ninja-family protein 1-like [Phragmites australis]|uniref:ninja-family protein 1-like n=1 Tax=Phragmites australis TaxID=29695 RepID=UPI002D76F32E|nr:ninja-family protein 1-like [Phragmites australis]
MEGYSRDLLCGFGRGDAPPPEQRPRPPRVDMEEVELSLGLSLGGRFGLERRGERLARSSSVAAVLMTPVEVAAPTALARTSSLPAKAEEAEVGRKQGLNGWGSSCRENGGLGVEAAARLPESGSPSSGSSDGEGQRLQVNIADPLLRTTSLPAGIDDECRKRKAAQSLKRLELKKKRIERRNSLTCNTSKEAAGQILEEMNANTEKLESFDEVVMRNKQNHSNDQHLMNGLPLMHQVTFTSKDRSLSAMRKKLNSAFKGTTGTEDHSPSAAVAHPGEGANGATAASPPFPSLVARAAALGSMGDQQRISGRVAARAKSMGDAERIMMQEMPCVCTKGLPNGNRVEGFLYKYRKGEEVRIVCVCHGSFLTPAEFVKHAGGGEVANPLRHIIVNPQSFV